MGSFLALTSIYFSFNLLYSLKLFNLLVIVYYLILPIILVFIPLFYLYIESVTTPGFRFRKEHFLHFIPAVFILLLNLPYLATSDYERINYISHGFSNVAPSPVIRYLELIYIIAVYGVCNLQLFYYTWRSLKRFEEHKTYIANRFSYTESISLNWIRALVISFIAFVLINDFFFFTGMKSLAVTRIFYNFCMLAITLFVGYHGMIQTDLPLDDDLSDDIPIKEKAEPQPSDNNDIITQAVSLALPQPILAKYSSSPLTEIQKQLLISHLERLILEEKIYTNLKLSIDDVARRLDTNSKYISQILNENYKQNFFAFINFHRIEEAKNLINNDLNQKYSIMGIAEMAGFSSKSTFYEAFKQIAGCTPSEFRKKIISESS